MVDHADTQFSPLVPTGKSWIKKGSRFETSAPQYAWMNQAIAVDSVMRLGKAVIYDAFTIK